MGERGNTYRCIQQYYWGLGSVQSKVQFTMMYILFQSMAITVHQFDCVTVTLNKSLK